MGEIRCTHSFGRETSSQMTTWEDCKGDEIIVTKEIMRRWWSWVLVLMDLGVISPYIWY